VALIAETNLLLWGGPELPMFPSVLQPRFLPTNLFLGTSFFKVVTLNRIRKYNCKQNNLALGLSRCSSWRQNARNQTTNIHADTGRRQFFLSLVSWGRNEASLNSFYTKYCLHLNTVNKLENPLYYYIIFFSVFPYFQSVLCRSSAS